MDANEMGRVLQKTKTVLTKWAPAEINAELAGIWASCLKDFPDDTVKRAFYDVIKTHTQFPTPAVIIRMCKGTTMTDEEIGEDVAGRIEAAIGRFGYSNTKGAEQYIGEIGWETIRQLGGWTSVCDLTNDQLASSRRQWRQLSTVISKKFHDHGSNTGPALPRGAATERPLALQAALDAIETITPSEICLREFIDEIKPDPVIDLPETMASDEIDPCNDPSNFQMIELKNAENEPW